MCDASKNEKIVKVGDERRKAQCGTVAEHQNAALRLMSSKHLVANMVLTWLGCFALKILLTCLQAMVVNFKLYTLSCAHHGLADKLFKDIVFVRDSFDFTH